MTFTPGSDGGRTDTYEAQVKGLSNQPTTEEEFEEAFTNCEDILRNALPDQFDLDPEVEAALVDASLEFSKCMRDEGISNFPDPTPGEFGFFAFRDADIEWASDDVQEAFEICQPENPLDSIGDD